MCSFAAITGRAHVQLLGLREQHSIKCAGDLYRLCMGDNIWREECMVRQKMMESCNHLVQDRHEVQVM